MPRLYVGSIGSAVSENSLLKHFSKFGAVEGVEIKEKKDLEGNIQARFSYLNIDAAADKIRECLQSLNGSTLKGSQLKVELAKESFLEKLKREQDRRKKIPPPEEDYGYSGSKNSSINKDIPENVDKLESNKFYTGHQEVADEYSYDDYDQSSYFDNSLRQYDDYYEEGTYQTTDYRNRKRKNTQDGDFEDNFADRKSQGFQNHDTFISNNKYDDGEKSQDISRDLRYNFHSIKRYDPTVEDKNSAAGPTISTDTDTSKQFVKISDKIEFNNSSSFTLASLFGNTDLGDSRQDSEATDVNQMKNDTDESTFQRTPLLKRDPSPSVTKKRSNFFVDPDDPRLDEALSWITTPLTEEGREEFSKVRGELWGIIKLMRKRALDAKKASAKTQWGGKGGRLPYNIKKLKN